MFINLKFKWKKNQAPALGFQNTSNLVSFSLTLFFNLHEQILDRVTGLWLLLIVVFSIPEMERTLWASIWHFALDWLNIYCPLTGSKLQNWGIGTWHDNFHSTKDKCHATEYIIGCLFLEGPRTKPFWFCLICIWIIYSSASNMQLTMSQHLQASIPGG